MPYTEPYLAGAIMDSIIVAPAATTDLTNLVAEYQRTYRAYKVAVDLSEDPFISDAERGRARKRRRTLGHTVHRLRGELRARGVYHGELPAHIV